VAANFLVEVAFVGWSHASLLHWPESAGVDSLRL
jgi:hypothetical protein